MDPPGLCADPGSIPVIVDFDAAAEIICTGIDPGCPRHGRELRETGEVELAAPGGLRTITPTSAKSA